MTWTFKVMCRQNNVRVSISPACVYSMHAFLTWKVKEGARL